MHEALNEGWSDEVFIAALAEQAGKKLSRSGGRRPPSSACRHLLPEGRRDMPQRLDSPFYPAGRRCP
jgi:hypothetical protein